IQFWLFAGDARGAHVSNMQVNVFRSKDIVIVLPESVVAVIEVKKCLKSGHKDSRNRRSPEKHPEQGDSHRGKDGGADEGRGKEGRPHRQGVEPVEADRLRGAAPGLSRAALQSLVETTRLGKTWG